MEESVTEFIWQMIVMVLFIGALSLFFLVNGTVRDTSAVVNARISNDRSVAQANYGETQLDQGVVLGMSPGTTLGRTIIFQIKKGLEVPIVVDGVYYGIDVAISSTDIEENSLYQRNYTIDTTGKLSEIRYVSVQ